MLWVWMVLWALVVSVLFVLLWRRARGATTTIGAHKTWLAAPLIMAAAFAAYWFVGRHPDTASWLSEHGTHRQATLSLLRGQPDAGLEEVPVAVLTRVLQRELASNPTAAGWYALALLYGEMEAPAVAVTAARKAAEMAPGEAGPQLLLARSLIDQAEGRLTPEAHRLLDAVLEEQPEHDGAWMMLGMAAMTSADYGLAIEAWDELLDRHPEGEAAVALNNARRRAEKLRDSQGYLQNLRVTVEAGPQVQPGGTLFVFLRKPGDTGQPLAAKRVLADRFPLEVRLVAGDWLQEPPPPGTPLVAGARYATGPGGGVDQAGVSAEMQPLSGVSGALSATLTLK